MIPFVSDRTALIIGATRGLGYALAETAIEKHHIRAIGLGRTADSDILLRRGALMVKFDLTNPATWDAALKAVVASPPDFVVWNAGILDRGPFAEQADETLDTMIDTHLRGPLKFLKRLHRLQKQQAPLSERPGKPYHLITIASTSWYRMRDGEAVYCMLEAAKETFMRQFARELVRDLPGSKATTVNPGGMKTDFLAAWGQDVSKMMDPFAVAEIIWREALEQQSPFAEINIPRDDDGTPRLEPGIKTPESPF